MGLERSALSNNKITNLTEVMTGFNEFTGKNYTNIKIFCVKKKKILINSWRYRSDCKTDPYIQTTCNKKIYTKM